MFAHAALYDKISRACDFIFKGSSEVALTSCAVIYSGSLFMYSIMQSIWSLCLSAQPTIRQQDVGLPGAKQGRTRVVLPTIAFPINYLERKLEIERCRLHCGCQKSNGRSCKERWTWMKALACWCLRTQCVNAGARLPRREFCGDVFRTTDSALLKDTLELSVRSTTAAMGIM